VLWETTSRVQCELVCPSRTNERGGEGYCVKGGGEGAGERERERAGRVRLHYILVSVVGLFCGRESNSQILCRSLTYFFGVSENSQLLFLALILV
jgi:hypothetical protein